MFADLPSSVVAVPEFPQLIGCGQFLRKDYDHQMNILSTPRMCRMLDVGCVIGTYYMSFVACITVESPIV